MCVSLAGQKIIGQLLWLLAAPPGYALDTGGHESLKGAYLSGYSGSEVGAVLTHFPEFFVPASEHPSLGHGLEF